MAKNAVVSPVEYSGIPLGGIGTGSFEIRAGGHFHDWQIMNNRPWGNGPATAEMEDEGLFFGIVVGEGDKTRELMLNRPRWFDRDAYGSSEIFKWTLDPYHLPWMEYPDNIDYDARFPFARLAYEKRGFPVKASAVMFSPFIPLDTKNSALPVAFLTFTLANATRKRQRVALFGAIKNAVGYDFPDNESAIAFKQSGRAARLEFSRHDMPAGAQSDGTMVLGAWSKKRGKSSFALHAAHPRDIYDPLMETGTLENLDRSGFAGGVGNNLGTGERLAKAVRGCSRGVLARTMYLDPGETADVTFAIAWHFPNMAQKTCRDGDPTEIIGHQYENWFAAASEVFDYALANFADLEARTREFVDAYYDSSPDKWILDAAAAQLTTLAKGTWWDRQGRFAVWEGLGCCGLQTMDVGLYASFPIVQFFPELDNKQMEMTTVTAETFGRPPHAFSSTFSDCCLRRNNRIDNDVQFALMVWRNVLWTGDLDFARRTWPALETFLKDVDATDKNADGLPDNSGIDQTYDQFPLYGTSAYVGLQYVAALNAAAEIARLLGNEARAQELALRSAKAFATLHEQLWNGEYYNLSFESAKGEGNPGCMADQLSGDWYVRQTTGEGLVDDARAKKSLKAVYRYCTREGFLANSAWPRGGTVKIRRLTSDQARCPWTGVEFAVAAEMILLGMEREGLKITRDVWNRYERVGMRYNHLECGDHYYRAMSSWTVYLALLGFAWDAPAGRMTLRVPRRRGRYVWNTPAAWGRVAFRGSRRNVAEIEVVRGTLSLSEIRLAGVAEGGLSAALGEKSLGAATAVSGSTTALLLDRRVTLKRGAKLTISI